MAKKITTKTISYKITLDKLEYLLEKIKDLINLDNTVVITFNQNDLLLYSVVGKNLDNVHAFKSHVLKSRDIFISCKDDITEDIKFVLSDTKKFVISMLVFIKYMRTQNILEELDFKLTYNGEFCEKIMIKNSKSKEETPGGKPNNHTHRLVGDDIESVMDVSNANYSFKLNKEDFAYIKSKTVIEKENDILYLNIIDNKLSIGENRWDHNICNVDYEDTTISFPKKYFKCINFDKDVEMLIYVTDMTLLIVGKETNLLIAIEFNV